MPVGDEGEGQLALAHPTRRRILPAMLEILNMLHFARFVDARLVGDEIHVTGPRRHRLIVSEHGDGYAVRAASDDRSAARLCDGPMEVIDEVKGWGD